MSSELVEKTAAMVKQKFEHEYSGHDWEHIRRVWQTARKIALEEKADFETIELAALLHDIADWKENDNNAELGEKKAREWLEQNKANKKLVENVCAAIHSVSFKGNWKNQPTTLEGKIVQDADRLDVLGAMGIIRSITWGAAKKRPLHNPAVPPRLNMNEEEYVKRTIDPTQETTINHFYEKLLLLKGHMHTKTAKKIAEHRHRFLEQFLDEFLAEWEGKR